MAKKKKITKRKRSSEDTKSRRKYAKGGRVEAYTFGDAKGRKSFPW